MQLGNHEMEAQNQLQGSILTASKMKWEVRVKWDVNAAQRLGPRLGDNHSGFQA